MNNHLKSHIQCPFLVLKKIPIILRVLPKHFVTPLTVGSFLLSISNLTGHHLKSEAN